MLVKALVDSGAAFMTQNSLSYSEKKEYGVTYGYLEIIFKECACLIPIASKHVLSQYISTFSVVRIELDN